MTDQTPKKQAGEAPKPSSGGDQSNKASQDKWPLIADRIAQHDPLIESLCILAGYYGRRTSPNALTSGLPMNGKGLITPDLFVRAAARTDMTARLVEWPLSRINAAPNFPCILVLNDDRACIVWKTDEGLEAQFPETPDERHQLSLEELEKHYAGYAFFLRPVARNDDRAGPAEIDTKQSWFWGGLFENRDMYRDVMVGAVMINLFALASPLFIMNVYDKVIQNAAFETLWVLAAGVLTVFFFDFMIKNLRAKFLQVAGRRADVSISAKLFQQVMGLNMAARPASAGVLASQVKEFESLRDFFTSAAVVAFVDFPFVFLFILLIAIIGGPLAIIPLIAVPITLLVGWVLQKKLRDVVRQSMNESALKNAHLYETVTGMETIKLMAAEGHVQRKWEELTDKASRMNDKARRISSLTINFSSFMQQSVSVFVVIAGVYMIDAGILSMGALIASVLLTGRAIAPVGQIAALLTRYNQSKEALTQLDALMRMPVERPKGTHFISKPDIQGKIEFKNVTFHYPDQTIPAIDRMNFTIEPGERVGIIGPVGSGKTTLERLLLNLYQPDSGSVQLDGTDVRQIDPGDLRRSVGVVQQSPQLFYGTVRENITMGHETAPERAVLKAAEMSGVMDFLGDTKGGLDTPVGERGESLSGGQRQAIAVARALLYDPPVLVLDEPTAAMDPTSENRLRIKLEALCEGKTVILITHKAQVLTLVEKLILIDRGRILDFGPKDDVINKLQNRQYDDKDA